MHTFKLKENYGKMISWKELKGKYLWVWCTATAIAILFLKFTWFSVTLAVINAFLGGALFAIRRMENIQKIGDEVRK